MVSKSENIFKIQPTKHMAGRKKHAILVLGMHRSGTSPLTRVLNLLGAKLPNNVMPPAPNNNEQGFWESRDLMVINDDILKRGMLLEKKDRLKALGSLATVKRAYEYDGKKILTLPPVFDPHTRNIWFLISHTLGVIMNDVVKQFGKENFYLFWVDAFFCKPAIKDDIKEYLLTKGYEVKYKELDFITIAQDALKNNSWFIDAREKGKTKRQ